MAEDNTFSNLLEKYSEYLVDASNKDDLLALGRRIFSAASTESQQRPSINLLREKEEELRKPAQKMEAKARPPISHTAHCRVEPIQNFSQDQINEEIKNLKEKCETLRAKKKDLQKKYKDTQSEYNDLIINSVKVKDSFRNEVNALKNELAEALVHTRPGAHRQEAPSILPVMKELSELNDQILAKISSFRQATKDALSHCERAALDRYKPYMDKLLHDIYENAEQLPIDQLLKRFSDSADNVDDENIKLQRELTIEHTRNENLQLETRQLEERLTAQQEEVNRMKKQQTQLVRDIAKLNEIAAQTMSFLKSEYQHLLSTDEPGDIVPTSARAVVVTPKVATSKGRASALKRDQSKKRIVTVHETKNPNVPSVEEYIEIVKKELQQQIQQGQY